KLTGARALQLVSKLPDKRQRQIIVMRYGLGGRRPLTQKHVAELLGISRSYVSRLEKSALEKLRRGFEG
ncbi:MAG: sigma-70 family RNA polymerase sigma factor, partial [Clostridia bacterium]|nr:sigma-70 family RNA polymerase sigma factor [Clostridia bacterium]